MLTRPHRAITHSILCLGFLALAGCESLGLQSDPTYSDAAQEKLYANGSLLGADAKGFNVAGGESKKGIEKNQSGMGVNAYLWRASLDTISFMPIATADPLGGLITTDWYSDPKSTGDRTRLTVLILDKDLRADGVKVSVFRETKDDKGAWIPASVVPETARALEDTILTRAREIRIVQAEKKQK